MSDYFRIPELADQIRNILTQETYRHPNRRALLEVSRLLEEIESCAPGDDCLPEIVASARANARLLYSTASHLQYETERAPSANQVRDFVRQAVSRAEVRAGIMMNMLAHRAAQQGEQSILDGERTLPENDDK